MDCFSFVPLTIRKKIFFTIFNLDKILISIFFRGRVYSWTKGDVYKNGDSEDLITPKLLQGMQGLILSFLF